MKCKHCSTTMGISQAIEPRPERCIVPTIVIHKHPVPLIYCYKCPKCGHSEYLESKDRK